MREFSPLGKSEDDDLDIVTISSDRRVVFRTITETWEEYFLSGPNFAASKTSLFTCTNKNSYVRFSNDGRWLEYNAHDGSSWYIGFYEITTQKKIIVSDREFDVVTGSRSGVDGSVLFQARENNSMPKVNMADADGANRRFIAEGMGESWSPNGMWFLIKRPDVDSTQPRQPKQSTLPIKKWTSWLYSKEGAPLLEVADLENPIMHAWSPDSRRFVMEVHGVLFVVTLQQSSTISYTLQRIASKGGCDSPSWSKNGTLIAFLKEFSDGHTVLKSEIWVASADGKKQRKLHEEHGSVNGPLFWTSDGKILFLREAERPWRRKTVVELTIRDPNGLLN